jgi:hypothetical protein
MARDPSVCECEVRADTIFAPPLQAVIAAVICTATGRQVPRQKRITSFVPNGFFFNTAGTTGAFVP